MEFWIPALVADEAAAGAVTRALYRSFASVHSRSRATDAMLRRQLNGRPQGRPLNSLLNVVFFLSGMAALIFETLWFHQAGLALGNSVWASSLVLAGFMGGLGFGNVLAARYGHRVRRPIFVYGVLEALIGLTGIAIVVLLPVVGPLLAPALGPLLGSAWALNALRLVVSLLILLVPSTAMGVTLPLLVKAAVAQDANFGRVLGRLYGWNTVGAVTGVICAEVFLIGWLGIRGSAVVAGLVNGFAAAGAVVLARRAGRAAAVAAEPERPMALFARMPAGAWRLLVAVFLAGGSLLALEVIWFRLLLLFIHGSSLAFALMLATVLAGIGSGGLIGSAWLGRRPDASRHAPIVALAAGILCVAGYAGLRLVVDSTATGYVGDWAPTLTRGSLLMFPVSMCSGILFPLLGAQLREWIDVETRAAGLLTFANTIGAMLGSLLACFALLPVAGVEVSLFGLAAGYGMVALLAVTAPSRRRAAPLFVFGTVFAAVLALFPFGLMEGHYLAISIERYQQPGSTRVVDVRESLTETIVLLEYTKHGEPVDYQLITNGFSMSGTSVYARRYMKLYVYWPVALRPDPRSALLISYGVGSTAKALTDTKSFESIDVVDISEGILEMSEQIFSPPDNPLGDPRVRVHVEDGRYFLQTTERRFDLITGEPPPPKKAGVVNLYTREYFQLVHDRLREQGVATYWLPVHSLLVNDSRAIIRAFCDAFDDCSLWGGMRFDWMLVGTRGLRGPPREEEFSRQWRDPVVGPELRALGFEVPEQLAALFMADAPALNALTRGVAPLTDDRPQRLSRRPVNPRSRGAHRSWMDTQVARRAFLNSAFIASLWPQALRQRSLQAFDTQRIINEHLLASAAPGSVKLQDLFRILLGSQLETLPLWVLGSSADEQRIVERLWRPGGKIPALDYRRAIGAVAQRDYALAGVLFERAAAGLREPLDQERTLVNCLKEHAENTESFASRVGTADFDQWYSQNCRSGNSRPGAKSLSRPATSK